MTKTYASSTQVSVFIGSLLVQFLPCSNGGSTYTTDKEYIQNGLERCAQFGRMYRLIRTEGKATCGTVHEKPAKEKEESLPELTQIEVACIDDAKDYLEEQFGIDRATLRQKSTVKSVAKKNGIEFVGI